MTEPQHLDTKRVEAERDTWRALAIALDDLCACYRTGKRPSGKLLDRLSMLREKAALLDTLRPRLD